MLEMSRKNNKESHVIQVAKKALEAQGVNFKTWSEDIIAKRQFELIKGFDEDWKAGILEEECQKFIVSELEKKLV